MRASPSLTVVLGVLAAMTAVLQLGPVWWPGAGFLLAMAATLPVAVGSALYPHRCTWFLFAAGLVIGLLSVEEMFVFLTTTGPLGLMLGMLEDRPWWVAAPAAAGMLTLGMLLMPHLAGVWPWGGVEQGWSGGILVGAYLGFALVYAGVWQVIFQRIWSRVLAGLRYTRRDVTQRSARS